MICPKKKSSQTTFSVDGIRCNHCESSIKLALSKVSGVKRVKIRKRKFVMIEWDANHPPLHHDLAAAIEKAEYRLLETP